MFQFEFFVPQKNHQNSMIENRYAEQRLIVFSNMVNIDVWILG